MIGCGKIGLMHARAMKNVPQAELVAIQSRTGEKVANAAQQLGVAAYTDIAEMIEKEKVDMVLISTPHPAHAENTLTALQRGAHVLVEKPLAVSLADCDAMIAAADGSGLQLGMISQRRFYPACMRIKQSIDAGKLGTPMLGSVIMYGWRDENYYNSDPWRGKWKEEGGGVLINQAPHQLDLLLWYMGSDIVEVYGVWQNINHPYIEVEDTAVAIIKFKNGAVGNVIVSNAQKPGLYGKVHIHGSNGASAGVQTDGGPMFLAGQSGILEPPLNDIWTVPGDETNIDAWKASDTAEFQSTDPVEYYLRLQHIDFVKAILEKREPLVTASAGRKTVALFNGIYRSMKEGRAVQVG